MQPYGGAFDAIEDSECTVMQLFPVQKPSRCVYGFGKVEKSG